jgi:hypothetical protein
MYIHTVGMYFTITFLMGLGFFSFVYIPDQLNGDENCSDGWVHGGGSMYSPAGNGSLPSFFSAGKYIPGIEKLNYLEVGSMGPSTDDTLLFRGERRAREEQITKRERLDREERKKNLNKKAKKKKRLLEVGTDLSRLGLVFIFLASCVSYSPARCRSNREKEI